VDALNTDEKAGAMRVLALFQVFHVYSRKMSRLPELIRQQRKRALGQPRTGRMSLVMTDIQSFTRLMENNADHTTQVNTHALGPDATSLWTRFQMCNSFQTESN
jgi:hypothetical protein